MAYYHILQATREARLLRTRGEFRAHMTAWSEATEYDNLPVGFFLGMEGAGPILWLERVHEWYPQGLRVISLGTLRSKQVYPRDGHRDRRRRV